MNIKQLEQHIETIVAYNWQKELGDFEEHWQDDQDSHVFRHLVALDNFINATTHKPEWYLKSKTALMGKTSPITLEEVKRLPYHHVQSYEEYEDYDAFADKREGEEDGALIRITVIHDQHDNPIRAYIATEDITSDWPLSVEEARQILGCVFVERKSKTGGTHDD